MKFYVKFIDAKGTERLGSEWAHFVSDLKTVRGVKNRVLKGVKPQGAVKFEVYTVGTMYNEKTYRLVDTVTL